MEHFTFFMMITQVYNQQTTKLLKDVLSTNRKLAKLRSRKEFLIECRKFKLHPRSLNVNLESFDHCMSNKSRKFYSKRFSMFIMNESIRTIHRDISKTYDHSLRLSEKLMKSISPQHFTNFKGHVKLAYDNTFTRMQIEQSKRFDKLLAPVLSKLTKDNDRWVVNLTNVHLPTNVKMILALGEKFNLPTDNQTVNVKQIIASCEPKLQDLGANDRIRLRNKICNAVTNFKNAPTRHNTIDEIIKTNVIATKQFLHQHPELLVLNADKSNVTVVMNKSDYHKKMMELLNDSATYLILDRDISSQIESQCNSLITKWEEHEYISDGEAKWMRTYNSVCAKMYGLIKVHKVGYPVRPIVSSVNSPTYQLSKMISKILKNVVGNTLRTIKNSTELANKLRKIRLPKNYVLISLDVVSLFTKIPKELIYSAINKKWHIIKKYTKLPKHEFLEGLKIVIEKCCFQYNGIFYQQIFGAPMGSPSSPVFADLILEILEEAVIKKLGFRLPFFWRYVDDVLTAVPEDKVDQVLIAFNQYNPHVQFTIEKENNQRISFLELLVIRDGCSIKLDWYHKPSWSGRYMNFGSHLPLAYKKNTVMLMTEKILRLSDAEFHEKNFQLLRNTLRSNSYPRKLVEDVIHRTKEKVAESENGSWSKQRPVDGIERVKPIFSIPYTRGLFESLKSICKEDFTVVGKGDNIVKRVCFSRLKDKTVKLEQSNVVYKVTCSCGLVYIGQTKQKLKKRMYQHKYNAKIKNVDHSAITEHVVLHNHIPKWDEVEILDFEYNKKKRLVLEMIHIRKNPTCINKQKESVYLSTAYNNVI